MQLFKKILNLSNFKVGFKFKKNPSKKLIYVMVFAILLSVLLIFVATLNIFNYSKNDTAVKIDNNKVLKYLPKDNVFNMKSYYAEYEALVYSNKNKNIYNFKESFEYKDEQNFNVMVEYQNQYGEVIYYSILDNKVEIGNFEQNYKYILDDFTTRKTNIYSLSTFVKIYSMVIELQKEKNIFSPHTVSARNLILDDFNVISLMVEFNNNSAKNHQCETCNISNTLLSPGLNISKLELKLDKKTGNPIELNIYDDKGNVFAAVTYTLFKYNVEF